MELIPSDNSKMITFLNNLDSAQLQILMNTAIQRQLESYSRQLSEIAGDVAALKETVDISQEISQSQLELERKRHRTTEHRYGFLSLSDLGQCYTVSIGSKTMGKLLRMAGLAKSKQSRTEPYRDAIVNEYAKSQMYGDNVTYQWNPEKCIMKIDKWLEKVGAINEFYRIDDEDELREFINLLYDRHGG